MAESKSSKKFDEVSAAAGAVTVTEETPAEADKTSVPNAMDADMNDPPVRTHRPDVPIAQVLGAGAGAHLPPDDPHIGQDGRWYADAKDAKATFLGVPDDAKDSAAKEKSS
jgi:hypothetical protein